MSELIAVGVGICLFSVLVAVLGPRTEKKDRVRSRLDDLSQNMFRADMLQEEELSRPFSDRVLKPLLRRVTELFSRILPIQGLTGADRERQKKLLMQAGWAISVEEYTVIHLMCMIGSSLLGFLMARISHEDLMNTLFYVLGGLFAGYTLLRYGCSSAATRRKTMMEQQLPDMLDLLSAHPALKACFDTNHLLGEDPVAFIRKVGRHFVTTHVSDYDFLNERHWLPGEGKLDWQSILKALEEVGYRNPWLYEISFAAPASISRPAPLTCGDFTRNAKELFSGDPLTVIGTPAKGLTGWKQ